jgi:hypothetical protein
VGPRRGSQAASAGGIGRLSKCKKLTLAGAQLHHTLAAGEPILIPETALTASLPEFSFGSQQFLFWRRTGAGAGRRYSTNLRSRTLLTSPSIMKFDNTLEPPALIKGSGIPVTGIRPTTIPTFTST